jgi:pantoate--beta-alanine ligase
VSAAAVVRTVGELRGALAGKEVSFVPTMGALHAGHASLIRSSAAERMTNVVSIFVNPTQFNVADDLAKYPRDLESDLTVAAEAGADLVFAPSIDEMYPKGDSTRVSVASVAEGFEGASRPGHFDGVATIVAKLFLIVQPTTAWFGEKDWQQCCVVSRLVHDLHMPVALRFGETVRESDGLAMSSRNARLDSTSRQAAPALYKELNHAVELARQGRPLGELEMKASAKLSQVGFDVDYFKFVNPETMKSATVAASSRIVAAASIGGVRLIDNVAV